MTAENAALITWARTLADPDWCLSVTTEAKQVLTRLADALERAESAFRGCDAGYARLRSELEQAESDQRNRDADLLDGWASAGDEPDFEADDVTAIFAQYGAGRLRAAADRLRAGEGDQ